MTVLRSPFGSSNFFSLTFFSTLKLVPKEYQMLVAIVVIVWGSAFVSAFIDNIPFVTAMVSMEIEALD